jgi:hypothetical protein
MAFVRMIFTVMRSEQLKLDLRRRTFAAKFNPADPFYSQSEYFILCPDCKGTRRICKENLENDKVVADLGFCERCGGDGFIERND